MLAETDKQYCREEDDYVLAWRHRGCVLWLRGLAEDPKTRADGEDSQGDRRRTYAATARNPEPDEDTRLLLLRRLYAMSDYYSTVA